MSPARCIRVPVLLAVLAGVPQRPLAGRPPGSVSTLAPLVAPGGDVAYLTRRAGATPARRDTPGGPCPARARLPGRFALPAVAYDGLPGGLSADGRTLVGEPAEALPARTPRSRSSTQADRLRRQIRLRGDFSFDAISPDGRPCTSSAPNTRHHRVRRARVRHAGAADAPRPRRRSKRAGRGHERRAAVARVDATAAGRTRCTTARAPIRSRARHGAPHRRVHRHEYTGELLAGRRNGVGALALTARARLDVLAGTEVLAGVDTSTHKLIPRRAAARPRVTSVRRASPGSPSPRPPPP